MSRHVRCRLCEPPDQRFQCDELSRESREHVRVHNVWETLSPSSGKWVYLGAYVGLGYFETDKGAPGQSD